MTIIGTIYDYFCQYKYNIKCNQFHTFMHFTPRPSLPPILHWITLFSIYVTQFLFWTPWITPITIRRALHEKCYEFNQQHQHPHVRYINRGGCVSIIFGNKKYSYINPPECQRRNEKRFLAGFPKVKFNIRFI